MKRFYTDSFPEHVEKYYSELKSQYSYFYESQSIIEDSNGADLLFNKIDNFIQAHCNPNYSIRKDFEFHSTDVFYAPTKNFGFSVEEGCYRNLPKSILESYSFQENYHIGLFDWPYLGITGLSSNIRKLIKQDFNLELELIKFRLLAYLKRYFIQGQVDFKFIQYDALFKHGIDKFPHALNGQFDYLEYSIGFHEKYGALGQMDGMPFAKTKLYKDITDFNQVLKQKNKKDYTYIDVIKDCLLHEPKTKGEVVNTYYMDCNEIGKVPLLKLIDGTRLFRNKFPDLFSNYNEFRTHNHHNLAIPYVFPIPFKLEYDDVFTDRSIIYELLATFNIPENCIREHLGLPKIGEGWISETTLYYEIKEFYKTETVVQHAKPKWLGKQHLDIYLPIYNIAIEYQGEQHSYPVEYFGGQSSFEKNLTRDKKKLDLCQNNNCTLIYVYPGYKIENVIDQIQEFIKKSK